MDEFATLFTLSTEPSILSRVIEAQRQDMKTKTICDHITRGVGLTDWVLHLDQGLDISLDYSYLYLVETTFFMNFIINDLQFILEGQKCTMIGVNNFGGGE